MTGHSLHIGLNHVDPAEYGGWDGALSGCIKDAKSMEKLATSRNFTAATLIDEQATSQAVIGAIGRVASASSAGDIVLITYSGHGGQVDDVDGEEDDKQDETWVLFDRQLVDDELYSAWARFAPGVRVLVLSDSCHSGTVVRGPVTAQVTAREEREHQAAGPGGPAATTPIVPRSMDHDAQVRDNVERRATYRLAQERAGRGKKAPVACSVLLISGCQDDQLSADGSENGLFTGTLLDVWSDGAFEGDYTAFREAILAKMPGDQSPVLTNVGAQDAGFMAQKPFTV